MRLSGLDSLGTSIGVTACVALLVWAVAELWAWLGRVAQRRIRRMAEQAVDRAMPPVRTQSENVQEP